MVICSSQDAPSLAHLHHRNLLNTPIPSMLQDISKQNSNNQLQTTMLSFTHEWLLVTYNNSARGFSEYYNTEQTNQWRHIRTCSWNATENPIEVKTVKYINWKTPRHPKLNLGYKPQQNYQEKLDPTLAFYNERLRRKRNKHLKLLRFQWK